MQKIAGSRKIDNLGRVTIPKGIRNGMNLDNKDEMEFYYDQEKQMFAVKPADFRKQAQGNINSLLKIVSERFPDKLDAITKLSEEIERILKLDTRR